MKKIFLGVAIAGIMGATWAMSQKTGSDMPVVVATEPSKPASAITLRERDIFGRLVNMSQYEGKPVVINFWATWCPPCVREIPDFVQFQKKHSDKVQIIGVSLDNSVEEVKAFHKSKRINYPILFNSPSLIKQLGQPRAIPTTYFLDSSHKVIDKVLGGITLTELESYLEKQSK